MNLFAPSVNQLLREYIQKIDEEILQGSDTEKLVSDIKEHLNLWEEMGSLDLIHQLKARVDGLLFLTSSQVEKSTSFDNLSDTLRLKLDKWQQERLWFREKLEIEDLITSLQSYPQLILHLTCSETMLDRFARWALVYKCGEKQSVEIFALHVSVADKIYRCNLMAQIGHYGGLKKNEAGEIVLKKDKALEKISNLRDELNEMEKTNHKDTDRDHKYFYGENGIISFNRYAHNTQVNLTDENYYKNLPKAKIYLNNAQIKNLVGRSVNDQDWVVVLCAARLFNSLSPKNTHSWVEVYRPIKKDSYELLISVGLWQKQVPANTWEHFKVTMGIIPGTIALFETSVFYRTRQKRSVGFSVSAQKGQDFIKHTIRQRLLDAREGYIPFQALENNCLKFASDLISECVGKEEFGKKVLQDQLRIKLSDIDHDLSTRYVLNTIESLPSFCKNTVMRLLTQAMGANMKFTIKEKGEEKIITTRDDSDFFKTDLLYFPAKFISTCNMGWLNNS